MSHAFLALWNLYPSTMTEEYEAWHTYEHVPERLTIPDMRGARRYAAFDAGQNRYFTLYELEDLTVVEHPAYLDLVRNPTPWSAKMRRHFSGVLRIPAITIAIGGRGIGRSMLVQVYSVGREAAETAGMRLARLLEEMIAQGTILAFRIGLAEPGQPYAVFSQEARTNPDTFDLVVMVDGVCGDKLTLAQGGIAAAADEMLRPRARLRDEVFELVVAYADGEFAGNRSQIGVSQRLRAQFLS